MPGSETSKEEKNAGTEVSGNHLRRTLSRLKGLRRTQRTQTMPASAPYIPARDTDFNSWLDNFQTLIAASPASYGLVVGDATAITAQWTAWDTAYQLLLNPATNTSPNVAAKDAARANAEAVVRPYAQRIRSNASVSDALKVGLGLNLQPATLTPIPAPTSQPVAGLRASTAGQAVITYHDSVLTGKAKPYGAKGVDVHVAYGTAPVSDPADANYKETFTKSPATVTWPGSERGKIATLFFRYRTQSGPAGASQFGPWSDPLSLTVT